MVACSTRPAGNNKEKDFLKEETAITSVTENWWYIQSFLLYERSHA